MPDQSFKKNISGCSSAFVPYSSLDSQQTAILATRKIVEILTMKLSENGVYSWLGDCASLQANNFQVSQRYIRHRGYAYIKEKAFANKNCKICEAREKECI